MTQGRVVSLFAGAGGLSRGFAEAGLLPDLAAEIDRDAVSTYRANVSSNALQVDIGTEADRVVTEAERRGVASDVFAVVGGPPCQGFSTAGARDHSDPRNRLVFSYLDIVRCLRPSWFLFENVEGILTSGGGDAVVGLAERFTELGYSFRVEKVNFAAWGVPQARKRVLIVGNRHGVRFDLPEPTYAFDGKKHRSGWTKARPSVTLGEAIVGLPVTTAASHWEPVPYATEVPASEYDARMRTAPPPGPKGHACANTSRDAERIRLLKPGQSLRDLPEELWPDSFRSRAFRRVADGMPTEKRGGAPAGIRRLDGRHASLTITSFSPRELVHPSLDRTLSLRECARLQGFPDGHDFHGGFQAVATQIGNAVPPIAAKVLAEWLQHTDGIAGGSVGMNGGTARPGLLGFHLTEASAMSPALAETDRRLRGLVHHGRSQLHAPRRTLMKQETLLSEDHARLGPEDRKAVEDGRHLGPISMSDRELARLVSVLLRDLGHMQLVPQWARDIPRGDYYDVPLAWFTRDEGRPFDFGGMFLACRAAIEGFRVIFRCITKLHRHRRKYQVILRTQPLPTMDQVARRGLLEYGSMPVEVLASWLTWRKWAYDVDNRAAQETGYLFEPMLVESLGGRSFSAKASPVKRADDPTKGRQVDCVVTLGGKLFAYEFKDRITIAASGQGRFAEELSFPRDCRTSGYTPVLMVMDPTSNPKLTEITRAFKEAGGMALLGDDVWKHLAEISGPEIATFVRRYIKEPVESIALRERDLLDFGMRYRPGPQGDTIEVTIGTHTWTIPRPRRDEAVAVEDEEGVEDIPG